MKREKKLVYSGKLKNEYYNFDLIEQYHNYKPQKNSKHHLSEQSSSDIDLKDFFKFIDRTSSSIGQQVLFEKIHQIHCTQDSLDKLEKQINYYEDNPDKREQTSKVLAQLASSNDYYFPFLIYGELPEKYKNLALVKILQIVSYLIIVSAIFFNQLIILWIPLFTINLIIHYLHKKRVGNFLKIFARLKKLTKCCKKIDQYAGNNSQKIHSNIKNIEKLSSSISFLDTENLRESDFGSIIWFLFELIKVFTLSEVTMFHNILKQITHRRSDILSVFQYLGNIDLSISIGYLRANLPYYCVPEFIEKSKELNITKLYHPLVDNCVSNDFHLKDESLLLTGSNMSGKSTFIKAISLNLIASQTLNTSFSKFSRNPIFALSTSIRITDNIMSGASYYLAEVNSIGQMLEQSNETDIQYLFVIDEVFKGTNTVERISGGKSILSHLNRGNHLVLAATHDIELASLLNHEYGLYYFQEHIGNGVLNFDYKLKEGLIKETNAINILEISGFPESVISEAKQLATHLRSNKTGTIKDKSD